MEFKGTPGTWFISGTTEIISMPSQTKICKVSGNEYNEAKHNALLISEAPKMLKMLNRIYIKKTVTFDDLIAIKILIKQTTEL